VFAAPLPAHPPLPLPALTPLPTTLWRPLAAWQPGVVFVVRDWPVLITSREPGALRLGVREFHISPSGITSPLSAVPGNMQGPAPSLLVGDTVGMFA
jgi:hypothetical protein